MAFPPDELILIERRTKDPRRVPMSAVWGAVFRTFLPGLLFPAALWTLYLLLRLARP